MLSWSGLRRILVVAAGVGLVVSWPGARPAVAASGGRLSVSAPSVAGPLTAPDADAAAALAVSSGQPVEVLGQRTDWAQTFAEPAGGFLFEESAVPVRVQQPDGSWVPVDTTLAVQPGGLVAPAAITTGLTLSGGGPGPLFTLSQDSKQVSVSWPYGALPVPSLSGPTATYAGVLPGVNLLVSATPTGVQSVLQVMSAAAAANPALASIRFPVSASGLSVTAESAGGINAADSSGATVFLAPPTLMWDSAGAMLAGLGPVTGSPGTAGPEPGDHVAVADVAVGSASVTVSPDASALSGPSAVYPVYIDPDFKKQTQTSWTDVAHNFAGGVNAGPCAGHGGSWGCWGDWEFTAPLGGIRAGAYCQPDNNGDCVDPAPDSTWGVYRSYLNFDVPDGLAGADYVDAQLNLNELWSWSCNASKLELWQTAQATNGLDWHNRPNENTWQDEVNTAHGWSGTSGDCPVAGITLNAAPALRNVAASGAGHVTLEVRASLTAEQASPPVVNSWKRFQATASTSPACDNGAPCLSVFWLHDPDQAQAAGTEGTFDPQSGQRVIACSTLYGAPDWVSTQSPRWDASDTQSQDLTIHGHFPWTNITTGATGTEPANAATSSGETFRGERTGSDGDEYKWQAYGEVTPQDQVSNQQVSRNGRWSSPPCYFAIDTDAPEGTVSVTADPYQDNQVSGAVGEPGTFTFTDPAYSQASDSDVVGFSYSVGSSQTTHYVAAANGTANITLKPWTRSDENLYVQAVDHAGNKGKLKLSGTTPIPSFIIKAATTPDNISALAYWKLNNHGTDATGFGNDVTLSAGTTYQCGQPANPPGYTCSLNGAEADTSGGVVSPEAGFTVSAWVQVSGCADFCVAMSEDGHTVAAFVLGWAAGGFSDTNYTCPSSAANGCWIFRMRPADDPDATPQTASTALTTSPTGRWVQLTGVFDAGHGTATLYVNGVNRAATPDTYLNRWLPCQGDSSCLGALRLGAGHNGNQQWAGNVSDACVFYGPLSDTQPQPTTDIDALYAGGCSAVTQTYRIPSP